jgi:hypothetical protein
MRPQAKQERKPVLQVVCPQVQGIGFDVFRKWIHRGIDFAREQANGTWNGNNLVLLFQERVVGTDWDMPCRAVVREVVEIQKSIPAGIHVFFSAAQLDKRGVPANMGWLVSRERKMKQPKRVMADGDIWGLDEFYRGEAGTLKNLWMERSFRLGKKPFPQFITQNGTVAECRVCADVDIEPVGYKPEKITLVAGDGLPQCNVDLIIGARKIVIVNDDGKFSDGNYGGGLRYVSTMIPEGKIIVKSGKDFPSLSILE